MRIKIKVSKLIEILEDMILLNFIESYHMKNIDDKSIINITKNNIIMPAGYYDNNDNEYHYHENIDFNIISEYYIKLKNIEKVDEESLVERIQSFAANSPTLLNEFLYYSNRGNYSFKNVLTHEIFVCFENEKEIEKYIAAFGY